MLEPRAQLWPRELVPWSAHDCWLQHWRMYATGAAAGQAASAHTTAFLHGKQLMTTFCKPRGLYAVSEAASAKLSNSSSTDFEALPIFRVLSLKSVCCNARGGHSVQYDALRPGY